VVVKPLFKKDKTSMPNFHVLLTVYLNIILGNDQLDTQLLYFTIRLLWSPTCLENYMLIIRSLNCFDAASGIVTLSKWLSGSQVERELVYYNPLHVSSIIRSSSGGWIVLMQYLVTSISVKWPSGAQVETELSTCEPESHLLRVTLLDAASVQFNLLMMSL
jgi:hypothetical protein